MLYWKKLLRDPAFRRQEQLVVVEGKNLVLDLFRKGIELQMVVMTKEIEELIFCADLITQKQYAMFSQIESPEGVAALLALPGEVSIENAKRLLVLDGLQDPGNVGTLLRTALAMGFTHVAAIAPCCDFWNDKVLRSAKGAHFSLKLSTITVEQLLQWQKQHSATLYGADIEGQEIDKIRPQGPFACILGNEGKGLRADLGPYIEKITIPMKSDSESLNVAQAGAIILYLLSRV